MRIIENINRAFISLAKQNPNNLFILVLNEYKQERMYKDYYDTLDSFGFKIGVECNLEPVYGKKDKLIGYQSIIKLSNYNILNREPNFLELHDARPITKAAAHLAKEYMYMLQSKSDLRKLVFA